MSGNRQGGSYDPWAPLDLPAGVRTSAERGQAHVFRSAAVAGRNAGAGVGLLLCGSLVLFHTIGNPTVPFTRKAIILAFSLPIPLFLMLRLARGGVVCDREGIIVRNPARHIRLRWDEIDHFEQQPRSLLSGSARVYRTDGSSVHVYGIVRNTSRRAELEAEPLIEALNQRLAAERAAA